MTSNIILKNKDASPNNYVTVHTSKVDDSYNKLLLNITPPTPNSRWSNGPTDTKIVDLLRVTHKFEIDGFIVADEGTYGNSDKYLDGTAASTVEQKKAALIDLFRKGGTMYFVYTGIDGSGNTNNYEVNIEKIAISEEPEDSTTVTRYNVKISLVEGVNI